MSITELRKFCHLQSPLRSVDQNLFLLSLSRSRAIVVFLVNIKSNIHKESQKDSVISNKPITPCLGQAILFAFDHPK